MAVQKRSVAGKGEEVALSINGRPVTAAGGTLLELLHQQLGLRGTRGGCGEGVCGACTVLVDGQPVAACITPVASVAHREIRTIEGLAQERKLHPVQEAFLAQGAYHCGYCGPGIIMETVALLERTPEPTLAVVQQTLNGHLCRCGVHTKIIAAVLDAAGRLQTSR
jgi:aerobic-type carbon monoxide dehydrogenase small subunit (CoxS/CutS family)